MTREELITKIQNAKPEDDKEFQEIIAAFMEILSLEDKDLAHMFGMSIPTANRWRTGANSPHPAMRPLTYRMIVERLQAT